MDHASPEKALLLELLTREGISKAELARRLGKHRSSVTDCLKANVSRSMLFSDFAEYAVALGYTVELRATKTA